MKPTTPTRHDAGSTVRRLDESTLYFLNIATLALAVGSLALIGLIWIVAPEQAPRMLTPAAIILVVGGGRYLLHRGHARAAIAVFALGTWLVATAGAAFMGGVHSTVIVVYPLIVIFTGWLMGARAAVTMTALTIAIFLGFALAELAAFLPRSPPTPPAMYWLIQAVVLSLSAATIVYLRRSHQRQVEEVRALTEELERKRAEAVVADALRDSLDNLRRTLEATDDGIFGYDGTDPSGRLLFANERFFDIWNIPRERAATITRPEIIAAARQLFIDPDASVRRIGEILAMGRVHEDKVTLNDGRVLFRRSIPLLNGSQVSRVWSFRDITAEERGKAALQASRDEAQRANAAKSEFLSRMSHELRTPLHAIMGMTAMARRRMVDTKGLEYLDKSKAAADHLLAVISDVLDLSKIEAGRMRLEHIGFRPARVIENVVNQVGHKAEEKGLRLVIDSGPGVLELSLLGDSLRLGQILLNFAGNAVKFTERGTVTIRVRAVGADAETVALRFEVEDTGIGISTADSQRLFVAFEQADGSMTRKYGGSGLGLAISRKLAQLMGGDVGFESLATGGSRFWFSACFERAPEEAQMMTAVTDPAADEARLRQRHAGARLLLAEDDPVGREIALDLLQSAGLRVDTAADGDIALDLARRQAYDLILMDMQMPRLNGIDATRAIRAASRNTEAPIVAMTANAFDSDRRLCQNAGMNDHLSKPVEAALLYQTVLKWLDAGPSGQAGE